MNYKIDMILHIGKYAFVLVHSLNKSYSFFQFIAAGFIFMRPISSSTVLAFKLVEHEFVIVTFRTNPTTGVALKKIK